MHFVIVPNTVDPDAPLIYMWEIRGNTGELIGRYVGKAKAGAKRPLTHYARNVKNVAANKPYRKGKPDGYRRVHRALAEAAQQGHAIQLHFLCNVLAGESINEAEQRCIKQRNSQGSEPWQLNG